MLKIVHMGPKRTREIHCSIGRAKRWTPNRLTHCKCSLLVMVTLFEAGYATAGDGANSDRPGFLQWFGGFQPTLDLRSRLEWADQKTSEKSLAWTTRARPGVLTPVFKGFQGFAEMELNDAIERDGYNAAGIHGPARKTAIADPESSELNRAWLAFRNEDIEVKAGRQRIVLDGARFIGNVG